MACVPHIEEIKMLTKMFFFKSSKDETIKRPSCRSDDNI
jgi:hypothetical protein